MELTVNYLAILIASIVSMVIGFLWYAPFLFGNIWAKLKGYTPESFKEAQKGMGKYFALNAVLMVLMAYVLAHVIGLSEAFYGYTALKSGFCSALFAWLGFAMPVQAMMTIYGDKKWNLFAIDSGYQLASLLAMGIVLGLMG